MMRSEMTQTESQQVNLRTLSYLLELQGAEYEEIWNILYTIMIVV